MKILKIIIGFTIFITISSNAQITKGNWMFGGNGTFKNYETTSMGISEKGTSLNLNPNIGYFFIDKLAVGTSAQLTVNSKFNSAIGFGPFVRYYILEKEKVFNIFSEVSYNIFQGIKNGDAKFETYNMKVGSVYFLTSSAGIELALNYSNQKSTQDYQNKEIGLLVGFQIHLEKK